MTLQRFSAPGYLRLTASTFDRFGSRLLSSATAPIGSSGVLPLYCSGDSGVTTRALGAWLLVLPALDPLWHLALSGDRSRPLQSLDSQALGLPIARA